VPSTQCSKRLGRGQKSARWGSRSRSCVESARLPALERTIVCPRCARPLTFRDPEIACASCGQKYPRVGRIAVLLPRPEDHVALWRRQLARLIAQGEHTVSGFDAEASSSGLLADGQTRLRALAKAVDDQLREIVDVVSPALGGPLPPTEDAGLPRGVVENIYFLYRDWGWDGGASPENQQSLEAVRELIGGESLGRTLVVGAGGCRLAYDLHRLCGASDTVVVDIDPYLFLVAEAVVRGGSVRLTESSPGVQHVGRVAKAWTLRAPAGPLDEAHFHFFLANGLSPPFAPGTFDTIVTPWFIDQVPPDLPAFLATTNRMLRPGGRWINHGPLVYPQDVPFARKFSGEEVFDLAARAGFAVGRTSEASHPHFVSPLNGRGKVEWVLTFVASKVGEPSA
jgi:SAM-dependent methyltransferase